MPSLSSFCAVEKPVMPFSIRKAVMPRGAGFGIGLGVDHQRVGVGAVGDPHLAAVEHVAVAALVRLAASSTRRRSRRRARYIASAPTCSPEQQLRQVVLLLRLACPSG